MKNSARLISGMIPMIFFSGLFLFQFHASVKAQSLSYTNSSDGLLNPAWGLFFSEVEFADVNSDGNIDIITIGDNNSPAWGIHGIMVYFGDGAGKWNLEMNGDFGYGGIAAGDVNNDGFIDIGYGMRNNNSSDDFGDQTLEVALGDGSGNNWTPWDDGLGDTGTSEKMFATDFADVDNDGDLDIGSISPEGTTGIHIYLNNSDGTWQQSFMCETSGAYDIFRFGDLNNDGFIDFVTGSNLGTAYFGDGSGEFVLNDEGLPSLVTAKRTGVSLGDVNNDGAMDLAFTNFQEYYGSGILKVYVFDKHQQKWIDFSGNLPDTDPELYDLTEISDMNMDGFADLIALNESGSTGTLSVFLGNGNSHWQKDVTFSPGNTALAVDLIADRDADHNGYPDILLLTTIKHTVMDYHNVIDFFRESSEPDILSIIPVTPRNQQIVFKNSIGNINWISAVPAGEISHIRLEYSVSGSTGPWNLIAENIPNNGCYQWKYPEVVSENCLIRYTVKRLGEERQCITPGAFTITNGTVGIPGDENVKADFRIFPNPANEQINIIKATSADRIELLDPFGRIMKQSTNATSSPFPIDISGLGSGLYFVRMIASDGSAVVVKFIKVAK